MDNTVKLVEVTRGELVESIHRGAAVVVDSEGRIIARVGNPSFLTFLRSAAKPIQALPVVGSGAAAHFGFTLEEIALLMASHSGEEEHVRVGQQIMGKMGLGPEYLQCGTHPPLHSGSARALQAKGQSPTVFHCTCSGKHAGMLALARYKNWPLEEYYRPEHPVQREMLRTIADLAGLKPEEIPIGIDGCGVPVFALTLEKMALVYARFAAGSHMTEKRAQACSVLQQAMSQYPGILAGTGRLATDLIKQTGAKFLAKDGNEGIFCIAVPAKGWGIALKIEDGHLRAFGPAVVSLLNQLDLLTTAENEALAGYAYKKIKNYRNEVIGQIRPAFSLTSRNV